MSGVIQPARTAPAWAVVIGIGNCYRRDDGLGPAVAAEIERRHLPGVRVVMSDGDPAGLDAWAGACGWAIIVDAARGEPALSPPGRVHRAAPGELDRASLASSHGLGLPEALGLGRALGRCPGQVVIFTVGAADLRPGTGLSAAVAAVVPGVVAAVVAELLQGQGPARAVLTTLAARPWPARSWNRATRTAPTAQHPRHSARTHRAQGKASTCRDTRTLRHGSWPA